MVKDLLDSVGKLIYVIKTILVLYFKLLLVIMWGISLGLFSTMSQNPALEPYSLGNLKLYTILLLGIYAVFRGLYYGVKDYPHPLINRKYTIGLKTESAPRKKKYLLIRLFSFA